MVQCGSTSALSTGAQGYSIGDPETTEFIGYHFVALDTADMTASPYGILFGQTDGTQQKLSVRDCRFSGRIRYPIRILQEATTCVDIQNVQFELGCSTLTANRGGIHMVFVTTYNDAVLHVRDCYFDGSVEIIPTGFHPNPQNVSLRQATNPTTVTAASSTYLHSAYDTHTVTAATAVTVKDIYRPVDIRYQ